MTVSGLDAGRLSGHASEQIIFDGPGAIALRAQWVEPPSSDEVIIETECSLISTGTEVSVLLRNHEAGSAWAGMQQFPFQPGYSNVGTVVAAGDAAADWIGARVSSHAAHASVVRWPAAEVRRVPATVSSRTASLCTLAEVALNAVRRSPAGLGSHCAVLGMGLVGQLTSRLLAVAGASVVWCEDPDPRRLALVPRGVPFRATAEPPANSCDVAFETSGNPAAMSEASRLTREGGTIAVVSSPSAPSNFDFHDSCNRKSLSIVGSHYFSHPPAGQRWNAKENGEYFLELVERDADLWAGLITEEISPENAPGRYATLLSQPPEAGTIIRWR